MKLFIKSGFWTTKKTGATPKGWLDLTKLIEDNISSNYKPSILGNLKTIDAAPTTQGLYILSDVGTYTNLGGLVTTTGKLNYAYFDGTTWKLISVDIPNFVAPIDNLTSTSTTIPLSANQGKVLDENKLNKGTYTGTASDLNTKIGKVETDYFEPKKNYFNVN